MRILMMDKYLTVGGVATYLKILCKALMESGHRVYLLTAADEENQKIIEEFTTYGIRVLTIPKRENRILTFCNLIWHSYKFVKQQPVDIMHSHHRLANFAGITLNRLTSVPHLITFHVIKGDYRLLHKLWRNEYVTVPSEASKKQLVEHYKLPEERVRVIHNTIQPEMKINPEKKQLLERTVFGDPEKFYIGFVGRISSAKGVDVLLKSIPQVQAECPDVEFRIFGDGEQFSNLKKRSSDMGLDSDRLFQGPTSNVNEVLSLLDLCVIPSRSESFCLFALECFRAGNPVVATNVGGIPEIITHNKTGLLTNVDDPDELAKNIIKLCKNKSLANKLAMNGRKEFEKRFPAQTFCQKYIEQYEFLINK